jgi:hypothetical protein
MAKLDLSNQDLSFENDFLVAVEWIDFEKQRKNVTNQDNAIKFSSAVFSGPYISRDTLILNGIVKSNVKRRTWNHLKVKEYSK